MKENKRIKAEYLLREIGEIDDSLIGEAQRYRGERATRPRLMLIAATLLLTFTVVIGSAMISRLASPDKESEDGICA